MRHKLGLRKLNRTSAHRLAMLRNMMNSLLRHEAIKTTLPKAKELRRVVEPMITLAKEPTVANKRLAFNRLRDREIVVKLFNEIGPMFKDRKGGYTRILKMGYRVGDNAPLAYVELVQKTTDAAPAKEEAQNIDEAHNLLERGREMYSAPLRKEDLLELKREIKQTITSEMEEAAQKKRDKDGISGQMTLEMTGMSKQLPQEITLEETDGTDSLYVRGHKGKKSDGKSTFVREGYAERISQLLEKCNAQLLSMKRDCDGYRLVDDIDMLVQPLTRLHAVISDYLEEQEKVSLEVRENLLDFYFKLSHFLDIYERQDENYVKYTRLCEDGSFELKLFCVNPRENLKECMLRGRSTILFSATFLPIQYYKNLLGGEKEDYEVYAHSVFDPEKRTILIAGDVTSKFSRRSQEEYYNIARYIHEVVKNRHGNYMIFFPSYSFMNHIYEIYEQYFMTEEEECLVQQESMNEEEREYFLNRFRGNEECDLQSLIGMEIEEEEEQTLIGFCVLGGIFGEGIDLKKDSLIGVIVVGTGLPQVGCEREILKGYFDEDGENGFDYSYRYPGMNKVLQAAGRVIRTAEDVGIIVLLDDRFQQYSYRRLFPREWEQVQPVTVDTVAKKVERFWDAWLWQKG